MMIAEAGFPPSSPPSALAVLLHLALLGLAVAAVVGLFCESRRPARPTDAVWWFTAIVAATVLGIWGIADSRHYRAILVGFMLFVWVVGGIGWMSGSVRLVRQGQNPAIGIVLGSLVALGLLIGFMLPAVPSAREAARRMQCSNNLKQLGLLFWNWEELHGRFPDAAIADDGQPPHSWRIALLPMLEASTLAAQYNTARAWDHPVNLPVAQTAVRSLQCPSNPHLRDGQGRYFTAYVLITGPETLYPNGTAIEVNSIGDGAANTLLLAEACGQNIVWTKPDDVDVQLHTTAVNVAGTSPRHSPGILSSYHTGGAHAALADGSVHFFSETMDPQVLRALTTASAGDEARRD